MVKDSSCENSVRLTIDDLMTELFSLLVPPESFARNIDPYPKQSLSLTLIQKGRSNQNLSEPATEDLLLATQGHPTSIGLNRQFDHRR
jgi:hypothetical protein